MAAEEAKRGADAAALEAARELENLRVAKAAATKAAADLVAAQAKEVTATARAGAATEEAAR